MPRDAGSVPDIAKHNEINDNKTNSPFNSPLTLRSAKAHVAAHSVEPCGKDCEIKCWNPLLRNAVDSGRDQKSLDRLLHMQM
eukprot:1332918-Rhodomonas_salina.2